VGLEGVGPLHSFSGRLQCKRFSLEAPACAGEDKAVRVMGVENGWEGGCPSRIIPGFARGDKWSVGGGAGGGVAVIGDVDAAPPGNGDEGVVAALGVDPVEGAAQLPDEHQPEQRMDGVEIVRKGRMMTEAGEARHGGSL